MFKKQGDHLEILDVLDTQYFFFIQKKKNHIMKPRTPGIPRRSPIQVLTGLDVA